MARDSEAPSTPPVIERFVKALVVAAKAVAIYPPASNIPLQTAQTAEDVLREALSRDSELRLSVSKNALVFRGQPLLEGHKAYEAFAFELYRRGLSDVRFHSGARARDIVAFLSVLKYEPQEVRAGGGFEARLWDQGVSSVTVTEAQFDVVDAGDEDEEDEHDGPAREELDEALAAAYSGQSRERVVIKRLLGDSRSIARYLSDTYTSECGAEGVGAAAERLSEMVAVAWESPDAEERARFAGALSSSLLELDTELRRDLLLDHAFPEAKTSEAMAGFLSELEIDEVCRMLVEGMAESEISREGLARALRTLALVSNAKREEVVGSAETALKAEGFSDSFIDGVTQLATPTQVVSIAELGDAASDGADDAVLRLMDFAAVAQAPVAGGLDPELAALASEAQRGITDGDVILALVDLVCIGSREAHSSAMIATLEDMLEVLLERGEIDIAADAAEALVAAVSEPGLDAEQRERIGQVMRRFSKPEDMNAVARSLRLHPAGSAEHRAATRLINALGAVVIEPLLEQLAEESDMGVRKTLVEVLSRKAEDHIPEFGARLGDSRWYVVRNVVSILGSTRSSAILPYLEKTLRHPEPRVRRETIRALSGLRDRRASAMLVTMLSDEDDQNVLLAARYLGLASVDVAVPALETVARGEGRGNRDIGPRVEAIEALGRIGDPAALPTLEMLAGRRTLRRSGSAREIRSAAETAIGQIKSRGGQRER